MTKLIEPLPTQWIITCLAQVCDFLMSAALTGGNTTLQAMEEAGSDAPPQPSEIQGIMEDLAMGSQPEPDQAQQASSERSQAEAGGGVGAESAGEPDQAAAPSSQPDQKAG